MHAEIIIAGFGGQGALFAGQVLAYAAMDAGQHVTWIPSYGPEMRGGTAHCTVIISDDPIGSPLVERPSAVIAMNQPSIDRYAPSLAAGGLLVYSDLPDITPPAVPGIRMVAVPATALAEQVGNPQAANLVLLGVLVATAQILPLEALAAALTRHLPERHQAALHGDLEALRLGADFVTAPPSRR